MSNLSASGPKLPPAKRGRSGSELVARAAQFVGTGSLQLIAHGGMRAFYEGLGFKVVKDPVKWKYEPRPEQIYMSASRAKLPRLGQHTIVLTFESLSELESKEPHVSPTPTTRAPRALEVEVWVLGI